MTKKIDIEIIDNFLDKQYSTYLLQTVSQNKWDFNPNITLPEAPVDPWSFGFTQTLHNLIDRKFIVEVEGGLLWLPLILKICSEYDIQPDRLLRARLDMTTRVPGKKVHPIHVDYQSTKCISGIYYLDDSDGDTLIFEEKFDKYPGRDEDGRVNLTAPVIEAPPENVKVKEMITPKKNRLVLFDGAYWHTGMSPIEHDTRTLLNFVFIVD